MKLRVLAARSISGILVLTMIGLFLYTLIMYREGFGQAQKAGFWSGSTASSSRRSYLAR